MKLAKVCYEETQNNCNKYVVSENSCSKNFVYFQEKHLCEITFLNKVADYLTLIGNVLGNLWNFQNSFHTHKKKKHPRMAASGISYHWKMFCSKYIFQKKISFNLFNLFWHVFAWIKYNYGCLFVAKLSWKKNLFFFWKNICVFYKIYVIWRKK